MAETVQVCSATNLYQSGLLRLTPVERIGNLWLKRDDLFETCGVRGGKARTCRALALGANGGLVTASARKSPQAAIVAAVARNLRLSCRVHTSAGAKTAELKLAQSLGAEIIAHKPGYNSVIVKRAADDAAATGQTAIPFGMECRQAIELTSRQMANLPSNVRRIVVPVGSGMTLAAILTWLEATGHRVPVLGVVVGANPTRRLDNWAPENWREMAELESATIAYNCSAPDTTFGDVSLDPVYEAKCLPFVREDDLLWVVGRR